VRGLFGAWIPGHFRAPLQRLRDAGWDARIASTAPGGTIAANAGRLAHQIAALAAAGRRTLVLAHSKGGLEVLAALAGRPGLARTVAGFAGVQMPRAGAPYLESVFGGLHHATRRGADAWRERRDAAVLTLAGARRACAELETTQIAALAARFDAIDWRFPWLTVASRSVRPTPTLELKHARLDRIRPGAPHDGVFYRDDQVWPGRPCWQLDGVDHAQPSVGGGGFDHGAFWCEALQRLLREPTP
jgi:hypothetical protein